MLDNQKQSTHEQSNIRSEKMAVWAQQMLDTEEVEEVEGTISNLMLNLQHWY